jgi:hypothetical protein
MSCPVIIVSHQTGVEIARCELGDFFRANVGAFHSRRTLKNEIRKTLSRGHVYVMHGLQMGSVELRPSVSRGKISVSQSNPEL